MFLLPESLPSSLEQEIESSLGSQPPFFLDVSILFCYSLDRDHLSQLPPPSVSPFVTAIRTASENLRIACASLSFSAALRGFVSRWPRPSLVTTWTVCSQFRWPPLGYCTFVCLNRVTVGLPSDNEILNRVNDPATTAIPSTVHGACGETGLERIYKATQTN